MSRDLELKEKNHKRREDSKLLKENTKQTLCFFGS